jgi:hypothetical protein
LNLKSGIAPQGDRDMAVGIFDSGLGGLTVLDAVQKRLPDADFVYLADSAHAPYGVRTADDIYDLTVAATQRLFDAGCDLVILACNTASAVGRQFATPRSWPETCRAFRDTGDRRLSRVSARIGVSGDWRGR